MRQRTKQRFVEQFASAASIEALDEDILDQLAGLPVALGGAALISPVWRSRYKLGAVIRCDRRRLAAAGDDSIAFARAPHTPEMDVSATCRDALARVVVHHREDAEETAVSPLVVHEAQRPAHSLGARGNTIGAQTAPARSRLRRSINRSASQRFRLLRPSQPDRRVSSLWVLHGR